MDRGLNPFQFTKPVPPSEVIDRRRECSELENLAEQGNNARLVAPRRYGKTSILGRVQVCLEEKGWTAVYVDLMGVINLAEVATRIEAAYALQLQGPIKRWFAGVRRQLRPTITLGSGPIPVSGSVQLAEVGRASLEERLALPERFFEKTGSRVHVVFDEFQEILRMDGNADAVVRSVIQHHGAAASYLFSGSDVGMMDGLFASRVRNRAFYSQAASVNLHPLPAEDLGDYVSTRFEETGKEVSAEALGALLDLAQGHPQRSMLIANRLWDAAEPVAGPAEWDMAFERVTTNDIEDVAELWFDLGDVDRRTVVALALGLPPHTTRLGPRGGATTASLQRLRDRGIVVREASHWRLVDPLFAEWLRRNRS